jgi:hypothetical protein
LSKLALVKVIEDSISPILRCAGFRKKNLVWRRGRPHFVDVFDVQKSPHGPWFYFNVGLWLRGLGDNESPSTYKCPVQRRIEAAYLQDALDAETDLPPNVRSELLVRTIKEDVMPWFDAVNNDRELKVAIREGTLPCRVWGTAEQYLESVIVD